MSQVPRSPHVKARLVDNGFVLSHRRKPCARPQYEVYAFHNLEALVNRFRELLLEAMPKEEREAVEKLSTTLRVEAARGLLGDIEDQAIDALVVKAFLGPEEGALDELDEALAAEKYPPLPRD